MLHHSGRSILERHPERGEFLAPPPGSRAQDDPPPGEIVGRGQRLRGDDRVAIRNDQNACADRDPLRRGGQVGDGRQRFQPGLVRAERERAGGRVGVGRAAVDWDEQAVGHPDRVVPEGLRPLGQGGDGLAVGQRPAPLQREAESHRHGLTLFAEIAGKPSSPIVVWDGGPSSDHEKSSLWRRDTQARAV